MPTGLEAQGTLAPVSSEGHRNRVRRQLQGTLRRTKQQDALTNVVYGAAQRGSTNQYMLDLGELAQSIGGDAGRDFFRAPEWYQSVFEKPSPTPKPDRGFLGRMGARFSDGTILSQMGRVGARALVGDLTTEEAKAMEQELRGRMSNMEWLQHAQGVGPEIERQLAAFGEMAGMQADILVNEAGIAALAGVALGSPAGPPGMAAAGLTGLKAGFAAGNMGVMAGLEYLDLLDQRIQLEDGTQVPIPDPVARATAGAVGVVNGVIEYLQWAMVPGGGRVIAKARDVAEAALSRMMREGTLRRLTTRAMLVGGFAGAAENVQEIAQEVGSAIAAEIALDIGESQVGGVRVDGVPLGEAIRRRVGDVLSVSGGIAMMGIPSGVRSFMGASRARATTSAQPDELFDRALMGQAQPVPMGDFQNLGPVSPRARALAEERVRAAQAGEAPLLPIQAQTVIAVPQARGEGVIEVEPGEGQVEASPEPTISVPAEADRALVEVLRQFGSPYVPATLLLPDGASQQEVSTAGPGAPRPEAESQALRRDPAAFDELWHQVRAASSVSAVSDEQVTAAAIVMEGAAINAGLSIREWMDRRFPNGLAMSPDQAARAVQAGETAEPAPPPREPPTPEHEQPVAEVVEDPEELRVEMYDALPPEVRQVLAQGILQALGAGDPRVAEAQRVGLLDGGRLTELGMWAESRARDEARAEEAAAEPEPPLATPAAPAADPSWTTVDPIRLEMPQVWPDEQGPAVIAWEGADGMLQVVGGHGRADLMRRMRAAGEFEAPVQVLRADDGWTLADAQARGPEFSQRTADTALLDVARTIRGLPLSEALAASLPLDRRRVYQALGLAQLGDVAWDLVEAGDVPAEHGAWIGILAEDHNLQHQLAESFVADPAETEYEAESRVRLRQRFGMDRSTPLARAFDQARMSEDAGDLQELAQQLAQRGGPLHQAANLEHLSEGEVWGRALHYWLSGAAPDLHLRSARSADDLLGFLRHLLLEVPAEQEAAAEPEAAPEEAVSSADELARAMFVRRFRTGDTVERPGGEQGTVVIDDAGVPLVRIGDVLEPVAARTASRWRRVERPADEIEAAPEGATPPAGPQLEAMLSLELSEFMSSIAGEPDAEPVVRAFIRSFDDASAIPEFVAAARARLQAFVGRRESGRLTIAELQPWRKYDRSRRWWFDLPEEQRARDVEEARAERLAGEPITPDEQRMVGGVESALDAVETPPEPTAEDAETELVSREAEDLHRTARRDWVASLLRQEPRRMFQRAYHVSPYKFDRFSTDFIGSGEGAQAYGHGLYFATSEEVKRHYEQSLRPFVGTIDGSPFGEDDFGSVADSLMPDATESERDAVVRSLRRLSGGETVPLGPLAVGENARTATEVDGEYVATSADNVVVGSMSRTDRGMWRVNVYQSFRQFSEAAGGRDAALSWMREEAAAVSRALQVIDANQERFDIARGGATYEVDLAPAEEDYLLWDEPLSAQSDRVKEALATLGIEQGGAPFSASGGNIYGQMAVDERDSVDVSQVEDDFAEGQRRASQRLLEAGIRGIKYQDWAARNQGQEGGYNYVIFSGDDVSIVQRMEQRRVVPGGEQAAKLIEQVVDEQGIADSAAEAGHVLPDGRFLARGEAARTPTFMEQTGAARMDGRVIEAAHPLTAEQIAAILAASDEGVYELVAGEQRMKTTEPLNADTLLSHFARGRAPTAVTDVEVLGVTEVDAAGRVQIALTEGADFDTLMEELFHVFRLDLPQDQEMVLGAWAGAQENPDGSWTWNEEAEETFARGAIQYLREGDRGRVPDAIRSVFRKIRDWLRRLYAGIRLQMPDDVRRAYEDLLLGSERPEVLAFERLQRAMHDNRKRVEFTDGDNQVVVQQMKRGWVVDQLNDDGERLARREHQDLDDALRDVAGLPTLRTPVPIGNPDFREAGPPKVLYLPEASPETNALQFGDVADSEDEPAQAIPSGSEIRVDPTALSTDPSRFQYKGEVDEEWIRNGWEQTKVWSPLYSGKMVVWQDNDGVMWVVDGHQRTALAKMLADRGQPIPPVTAIIYHEADTTAEEARRFGALKNLVEGTGTEVDAAKVLRDLDPDEFDATAATLGTSNTVIETARGLVLLSDEAFEIVARGVVSPLHASKIGELAPDPTDQLSILREFAEEKPASAREAEMLVKDWMRAKREELVVEHSLFGVEMVAESYWRERARLLARSLSALEKRRRIFAAVSKPTESEWLQRAGNVLLGEENAAEMDQAAVLGQIIDSLAQQQGPISDALNKHAEAAREKGRVTSAMVNEFLGDVEQAISDGDIALDMVRSAGSEARIQEAETGYRLFQQRRTPAESRDVGRRQARAQDIRTVETEAGQSPRTEEPAGGHTWASARATLRKAVSGARNRAAAVARREAVDTIARIAKISDHHLQGGLGTRQSVNRAARAAIREAQAQATEREARRAAAGNNLRHGRERVRRIQRSLRDLLQGSRTIPEPLRTELRQLVAALDIDRTGRMTTRRLQPGQGEVDPLRLLSAIDAILVQEDRILQGFVEGHEPGREAPPSPRLPGANPNIGPDTTLRDMSLLDLERLHRRIQAAVAIVRKGQAAQQQQRRDTLRQEVAEVAGELVGTKVALSNRVPRVIGGAVELLGISSERPNFFLERITGMASRTYDVFWRRVKAGTQTERRLHERVTNEYIEGLRSIGIDMTGPKFEQWLNERLDAPGAAAAIKAQWTRAEVMSFAMTWADPYAREHLTEGGLVIVDDPLKAEPVELGLKEVTEEAAEDLIGLLGDQERAMIADDGPVRALFEHLFYEQNKTFREINGYDLEKWPSWYPVHVARAYIPDTQPDGSALGHFQHGGHEPRTSPFQGFLAFREGSKKPISIRPISTEINSAIRHTAAYVGLEPALRTARSALYNPRVQTLLERQGKTAPRFIERYLQGVAHNSLPPDRLEGALNTLRQNVTVATLASPAVSMKQALSLAVAGMHVPSKYIGMAVADLARPGAAKAARDRHRAFDPDFAVRLTRGFDIDVANRGSRQAMPESRSPTARRHARFLDSMMWGLSAVDSWTVTRVEQAAVNHAMDVLADGTMPKRMQEVLAITPEQAQALPADRRLQLAYSWGNWVVARTQPSHLPENIADLQRRRGMRLFTSFSGYTNVAMNSWRSSLRHLVQERSPEAAREAAWAVLSIAVLGPLGAAIMNRLRDIAYQRDEEDRTPILVDAAMGIAAQVYFIRDLGFAASTGFGFGGGWEPPVVEALWNVARGTDRVIGAMATGDNLADAMLALSGDGLRLIGMPVNAIRGHGRGLGELTGLLDD